MSVLQTVARAALVGGTLLLAALAQADPVPAPVRSPGSLSDMQTGRLLLGAGRLEHARTFLEQARPATEEESIERLFLLGRIEMRLGMPERAAERFEAILAMRPDLTRVRLEVAQAYFLTGRDDKARFHFDAALGDELPSSAEAAVEGFLRRIDARKRWAMSFSASLLPEIRRTDQETVLIGGVPFRLNEDARSPSGTGALVTAGFSFSPAVADDLRGVLAASAAARLYERSDWNDASGSADVGLARLFGKGSASGGLRVGRRWIGGDGYRRSLGPWAQARLRLSGSLHLNAALSAGYRTHDTRDDRDGWRIVASPRLRYVPDGRTSIEAEPVFETVGAVKDHHGSRLLGLRMAVSRAFQGGLTVTFSAGTERKRHTARDPLFGRKQDDRSNRLKVTVLHRSLRFKGVAPFIGFSVERTRSNIPVYESRSHGAFAGLTRRF